jgi:hypothetical protein
MKPARIFIRHEELLPRREPEEGYVRQVVDKFEIDFPTVETIHLKRYVPEFDFRYKEIIKKDMATEVFLAARERFPGGLFKMVEKEQEGWDQVGKTCCFSCDLFVYDIKVVHNND